jgi:hypothetical protein
MYDPPPVRPNSLLRSVVLVVVASLAGAACKNNEGGARPAPPGPGAAPAARADAAAVAGREGAACAGDDACGFGLVCTSGRCANSECHDGDPMNPPRACGGSRHCEFAQRGDVRKGRGRCVEAPTPAPAEGEGGAAVPPAAAP